MSESFADPLAATALSGTNADFIEALYHQYLSDPNSVDPGWARHFAGLQSNGALPAAATRQVAQRQPLPSFVAQPAYPAQPTRPAAADTGAASAKQAAVSRLIQV